MADLPTWPVTLPDPRASGYGIQPVTPYARTDMDNGAARQRRRFTSVPSYVSVTWRFTHSEHALFEGFLAYEINLGTDWFAVGLLNGMGVNQVQARFKDDPPYKSAISDSRAWFDVTATLEVKALPLPSRDEYDVLRIYTGPQIEHMDGSLHRLIHVTLPGPDRWN
jgi:hypothetical protein